MMLSLNFSYDEMIKTHYKLNNTPNPEQLECLKQLVNNCLQPIRNEFGAININSGFRSVLVNKMAKGSKTSQHLDGEAADFEHLDLKGIFYWIMLNLEWDQLIWEFGDDEQPDWLHISYKEIGNRKDVIRTFHDKKTQHYDKHTRTFKDLAS